MQSGSPEAEELRKLDRPSTRIQLVGPVAGDARPDGAARMAHGLKVAERPQLHQALHGYEDGHQSTRAVDDAEAS